MFSGGCQVTPLPVVTFGGQKVGAAREERGGVALTWLDYPLLAIDNKHSSQRGWEPEHGTASCWISCFYSTRTEPRTFRGLNCEVFK